MAFAELARGRQRILVAGIEMGQDLVDVARRIGAVVGQIVGARIAVARRDDAVVLRRDDDARLDRQHDGLLDRSHGQQLLDALERIDEVHVDLQNDRRVLETAEHVVERAMSADEPHNVASALVELHSEAAELADHDDDFIGSADQADHLLRAVDATVLPRAEAGIFRGARHTRDRTGRKQGANKQSFLHHILRLGFTHVYASLQMSFS